MPFEDLKEALGISYWILELEASDLGIEIENSCFQILVLRLDSFLLECEFCMVYVRDCIEFGSDTAAVLWMVSV